MTPEQFAYWLQGFAEVHQQAPNAEQWQIIRDHLQLVFKKVTPDRMAGPATISPALPPAQMDELQRLSKLMNPQPAWPGKVEVIC